MEDVLLQCRDVPEKIEKEKRGRRRRRHWRLIIVNSSLGARAVASSLMSNAFYLLLSASYFFWFNFVVGIHLEHLIYYLVATACYFKGYRTRRLLVAVMPYLIYVGLYDSMRAFPSYAFAKLRIQELYDLERDMFGVRCNNTLITLNEFFALKRNAVFTLLSGLFYINWLTIPLGFAVYLYHLNKRQYMKFSIEFLLVNILGFIIYYVYPAAPPWYIQLYGFEKKIDTTGNAAGLNNVDDLIGIDIFRRIYSRNSNVFATMPSLHAAYPALCFLYAAEMRRCGLCVLFSFCSMGIWLSAIYTGHHYVLDVIGGVACSLVAFFVVDRLLSGRFCKRLFDRVLGLICQEDRKSSLDSTPQLVLNEHKVSFPEYATKEKDRFWCQVRRTLLGARGKFSKIVCR